MEFVSEQDIRYYDILHRGGSNGGDEDFAFIQCPSCRYVYLVDYEVDTIYLDGADLTKRLAYYDRDTKIACVNCNGEMLPDDIWKALRHEPGSQHWQVSWSTFEQSHWAWAAKRT